MHIAGGREGEAVVHADEGVGPDTGDIAGGSALRRAERQIDGDGGVRIAVDGARVAVAGNGVVAAEALELVELAVVADVASTGKAVSGRDVGVVVAGDLDAFDRAQRG